MVFFISSCDELFADGKLNQLLMIDVVANNYAYAGPGQDTVFSDFVPFNSAEYFHPFCYISNYNNDTDAQNCWLGNDIVSLPDLNTESEYVMSVWDQWAQDVIANYSSISPFRSPRGLD
jgi:alpha-amylase